MERRLVGSTLATLPHEAARRHGATSSSQRPALSLIGQLMGDADDQVQKALSLGAPLVEPGGSRLPSPSFLASEATLAVAMHDGHRAWVIRDALTAPADPRVVKALSRPAGRHRASAGAPSTSTAAAVAATFGAWQPLADQAIAQQGDRYARRRA